MSGELSRTVVVGVGRAGIDVLRTLAAGDDFGWGEKYEERFKYVAVAADPTVLRRAPQSASEVQLSSSSETLPDGQSVYPYLFSAPDTDADAIRKSRALGRCALDNQDGDARELLRDTIEQAFHTLIADVDDVGFQSCNVVHVHAMGSGTGSGTFPIVAHLIDEATDHLHNEYGVAVYTAGIGIAPELSLGHGSGFKYVVPRGERWRYANTYAALKDLERLTQANPEEQLPVHFYNELDHDVDSEFVLGKAEPQGYIGDPPYRHYFLVDDGGRRVNHDADQDESTNQRIEEVVAAINGLAALGPEIHSWLPAPAGVDHFGSFGQAQLSIPIKDAWRYCHLDDRIAALEEQITTTTDGGDEKEIPSNTTAKTNNIQDGLGALKSERKSVLERITTPRFAHRRGRLALDERMVRENLSQEALEKELTSLNAFYEAGYLNRDLQVSMRNRVSLASAWHSQFLTWSEGSVADDISGRYAGQREVWMLHSEENTPLPGVDCTNAGLHTFRRSGNSNGLPNLIDPYTIQFLTYCVEAPLSDLRMYAELDAAASDGFDTLLEELDDYRDAFAYPEWYDRNIRQYYNIHTHVELPRPLELDLESVRIDRTGEDLRTWLSSHGLASYLWLGDEWDRYEGYITTFGLAPVGWRERLTEHGMTYHDMRTVIPNGEPVAQWCDGKISWDDLLSRIVHTLAEHEGLSVEFTTADPS